MPQNTPRGYTYPCYSDAVNFPAQIQDLATDIDGDVQGILDNIEDARDTPPSCKATGSVSTPIGAGLLVTLSFNTQVYDNAAIFTPPSPTFTIPVEGLYLITYGCTFDGTGGVRAVQLGVGGFIRSMQTQRRTATLTTPNISVRGVALTNVAAATVVNLLAGSSVACNALSYQINITRMTGNTIL